MCVFCDIIDGKEKSYKIYENSNIIAFLDNNPINEGPVLIAPKEHYLDIDDLPIDLINEIMDLSRKIVIALKRIYTPRGYSLVQNGGEFNEIGHFHIHIFPRYYNDGFGWIQIENKNGYNKEALEKITNTLKNIF